MTDYLETHLAEDVGLAELAGLCQLSVFHFCRAFKSSTGISPYRFLIRRRMVKASELLTGTRFSITHIAACVGYDDPGYFAKLFKRETGMTPLKYRQEHRC